MQLLSLTVRDGGGIDACQRVAVQGRSAPTTVVVSESSLGALNPTRGFDEWILPTASPAELETRLQLVGRLGGSGDLVVNEASFQVRLRGEPLDLTFKEFELLRARASHPGRVYTRELLLQEIWGYDYFGGSRTVDVHVRRPPAGGRDVARIHIPTTATQPCDHIQVVWSLTFGIGVPTRAECSQG